MRIHALTSPEGKQVMLRTPVDLVERFAVLLSLLEL